MPPIDGTPSAVCCQRKRSSWRNSREGSELKTLSKLYVKAMNKLRGQTMTEYALILAAVAIVVFATYELMGQDIGSMVNKVNTALTSAS
jgi:Flp pilus assembly pilin Flp